MPTPEFYWIGASGKVYGYWIKTLPFSCDANQKGNYIFAKFINNMWYPVYIGQGDINERIHDEIHYNCAISKGATHVHVHTNPSESTRLYEERDLLNHYYVAYVPSGCNEKIGG